MWFSQGLLVAQVSVALVEVLRTGGIQDTFGRWGQDLLLDVGWEKRQGP